MNKTATDHCARTEPPPSSPPTFASSYVCALCGAVGSIDALCVPILGRVS